MKIAYFVRLNIDKYPGVYTKILDQTRSWRLLGEEVMLFLIVPKGTKTKIRGEGDVEVYEEGKWTFLLINTILDFFNLSSFYNGVYNSIDGFKPDAVYIRSTYFQKYILRITKKYRSILEINTDEFQEYELLAKSQFKYKIALQYFKATYKYLIKHSKKVIAPSFELRESLKNRFPYAEVVVIPNSVYINRNAFKENVINGSSRIISAVFMGTPNQPWQGVDRLEKFAESTEGEIEFHVIGYEGENTPNITYYGYLERDTYGEILRSSDIGFGTLALHRKGLSEACPLKVRDYLLHGLPIVIAYNDTAFIDEKPEWVLKIPNNEEPLDAFKNEILSFANKMKGRKLSYDEVNPYIGYEVLEDKRLKTIRDESEIS